MMAERNRLVVKLATALLGVAVAVWVAFNLERNYLPTDALKGFDFQLRYNEARCVLSGVDPARVWSGEAVSGGFRPWSWACRDESDWHNYVGAYPPWEYAYLLPFAMLEKPVAAKAWLLFEYGCLAFLLGFAFVFGFRRGNGIVPGLIGLAVAACVLRPAMACLSCLNFGLPIAAGAVLFCVCMNRGWSIAGGLCWALMMSKPQLGLLFAVPVLMERRYRTLATAVLTCLAFGSFAAWLCDSSFAEMLTGMARFRQEYPKTGGLPMLILPRWLSCHLPPLSAMALNAALGVFACCVMTHWWRRHDDWFEKTVPTLLLCSWWSVSRLHDDCVHMPVLVVLVTVLYRRVAAGGVRSAVLLALMTPLLVCARSVVDCFRFPYAVFDALTIFSTAMMVLLALRRNWKAVILTLPFAVCAWLLSVSCARFDAFVFSAVFMSASAVIVTGGRSLRSPVSAVLLLGLPWLFVFAPDVGVSSVIFYVIVAMCLFGSACASEPSSIARTYCVAGPGSLIGRLILKARVRIYGRLRSLVPLEEMSTVLDDGVTADRDCEYSNFFEELYPHPERITALSDQDASWMCDRWKGVRFVRGDGRRLPFADSAFDLVFSSAVIEHVGFREQQHRYLLEAVRVARRHVFLTTPNRWFPVEMHSCLPFVHWLPARMFRWFLRISGRSELARESCLNLLTRADLAAMCKDLKGCRWKILDLRFFGFKSNLLLHVEKLR